MKLQAYTAWQLFEQEEKEPLLTLGDTILDKLLNGGLRQGIIEISGEAGTGKSSLGMQLCFQCCLPCADGGLDAKAIYLSTEGRVNQGRFNQLYSSYSTRFPNVNFGERILFQDVLAEVTQKHSLFQLLPAEAQHNNVKLVVLDSISTFYRPQTDYIARAKEMNSTCQHLRRLSLDAQMKVVLINQVTDVFADDALFMASSFGSVLSSGRKVKPALGLAWSNIIGSRIMLAKTTATRHSASDPNALAHSITTRQMHVVFSPQMPSAWANFEIGDGGIRGVEQETVRRQSLQSPSRREKESSVKVKREVKKAVKQEQSEPMVIDGLSQQELADIFNSDSDNEWR